MSTPQHLAWANAVSRLRPADGRGPDYLYLGSRVIGGAPYVVPARRANPHVWVMGGSGTGKTALVLSPLAEQLLASGRYSVVVLDPKPDRAMFQACREACAARGLPFRQVCVTPGLASYAFAPMQQSHAAGQSLNALTETLVQGLNLDHGVGYGRSYFSAMDAQLLRTLLRQFPDARTPERVARLFDDPAALRGRADARAWADAAHVRSLFTQLAGVTPLNVPPRDPATPPDVAEAAVDLWQPFARPQCVYFALDSARLRATSRTVLGLAFYNLLAAAKYAGQRVPEAGRVPVVCLIDEAQELIAPNLTILMEQSRSLGVQLVLAHQNFGQLRTGDADYSGTFEENTGLHVVFNPTGQAVRDWMERSSGERLVTTLNWEQEAGGSFPFGDPDALDPRRARRPGFFERPRVSVGQRPAPYWDRNALMRLSATRGVAWVRLARDEGPARDGGQWTPVRTLFPVDRATYDGRERRPWPGPGRGTVVVERVTAYDRNPGAPPPGVPGPADLLARLGRLPR